jgi:hypothetical protein
MWNGPHRCPSQDASADKKLTPASDIVPSVWRPRRTDWRLEPAPAVSCERRNILAIIGATCAKEITKCVVRQIMESV